MNKSIQLLPKGTNMTFDVFTEADLISVFQLTIMKPVLVIILLP